MHILYSTKIIKSHFVNYCLVVLLFLFHKDIFEIIAKGMHQWTENGQKKLCANDIHCYEFILQLFHFATERKGYSCHSMSLGMCVRFFGIVYCYNFRGMWQFSIMAKSETNSSQNRDKLNNNEFTRFNNIMLFWLFTCNCCLHWIILKASASA